MAATVILAAHTNALSAASFKSSNFAAEAAINDWLVLILAASNDGTNGASCFTNFTLPDGGAATFTERARILYDPGTAGQGAEDIVYTALITSAIGAGIGVQANFSPNVSEAGFQVYKISPGAGEAISFVAADTTGSTGNTNSYTAATISVASGDIIFGTAAIETDDTITGDSDTTMGSWSTVQTDLADGGADASTMSCVSQYKTTTGTGNQAWAATTSTARDSARTYLVLRSAASGVDLALTKTLAAVTSSAAYTVDTNTATLAKTLGAVTLSSAYTVDTNTATLSKTLGAVTSSAVYTVESQFSLSKTLGTLTSSAAYNVDALYSLGKTLQTLTASGAYTVDSLFSTDKTLGALTSSAVYTIESQFSLSKTLDPVTLSSTFTSGAVGSDFDLSKTLGALTSGAAFTVESQFSLSRTLGTLTASSAYTVDTNNAALSQTLAALTSTGSITVNSDFTLAKTLADSTSASVFTVSNGPEYALDKTLDALTAAATFAVTGGLIIPPDGPHGPGWKLFGHVGHDRPPRSRKADTLERDIVRAYNRAHGIEDEEEQAEAVRELKHVAATALSVGKQADDVELVDLAQQIIALKRLELDVQAYLSRVGAILEQARLDDADDMEALMLMAGLVCMVRRIRRDVPTENSSIYTHGHLRKLDGNVSHYMSGIGTWEPLTGNATGTLPAPPDKSVQFNDGLTAFGGNAGFLFDKTNVRASLGSNSSLGAATILDINGNYTAGSTTTVKGLSVYVDKTAAATITDYIGVDVRAFETSSSGVITNLYGVRIKNPDVDNVTNAYGLYIEEHPWFDANTSEYNIYSAGAEANHFFNGASGFHTVPSNTGGTGAANPSTSVLVGNDANDNTFAFRQKNDSGGVHSRNFIEGKWQVNGHSAFGNRGSGFGDDTSVAAVINVSEAFSGALTAGTYSSLSVGSTYAPSSGSPTVYEVSIGPIVQSGTIGTVAGILSVPVLGTFGQTPTAGAVIGVGAIAQCESGGTVTSRMVGCSGEIVAISNSGTTLPYVAAFQTIVSVSGSVTVTNAYGLYVQLILNSGGNAANVYGLYVAEQTAGVTSHYNIYSDHTSGQVGHGMNFLGAGAQIGATDLNISRFASNILGIGTGLSGNVSGKLRCAAAGLGGNISGSEVLTVTGDGSASGYWNAGSYKVGGVAGASGNFTTVDLKTVTVVNGIVTSIA